MPTLSPTELAELRARAPALIADAKRTVTPDEVKSLLTPLALVLRLPAASESGAFWALYAKVLAPLHPRALRAGVEAYLAQPDARFFPEPGPLLEASRKASQGMFLTAIHANAALRYREPKSIGTSDPAVTARIRDELASKLKRSPPPRPFSPPPTPTDETGLSAAMRDLMNRQGAS